MGEHEPQMPRDPDEDDLPPEIEQAEGPFSITGVDEDGNVWEGPDQPGRAGRCLAPIGGGRWRTMALRTLEHGVHVAEREYASVQSSTSD